MVKYIAISIVSVVLLCATSFWVGKNYSTPNMVTETVTIRDTTYIPQPEVAVNIQPLAPKIVFLNRYIESDTDTIAAIETSHGDSVLVSVPISEYTFRDSLYDIRAKGAFVELTSVALLNTTTTTNTSVFTPPKKHWNINASLSGCVLKNTTNAYARIGVEYTANKLSFEVGYQFLTDGTSGVYIGGKYKICEF